MFYNASNSFALSISRTFGSLPPPRLPLTSYSAASMWPRAFDADISSIEVSNISLALMALLYLNPFHEP